MEKPDTIFVDLDGTLILTDLFVEGVLQCIKSNVLLLLLMPLWLIKGRMYFKRQVAKYADFDFNELPYNLELIDWLKGKKAQGAKLILVTASLHEYAKAVQAHLGFFDSVQGSVDENLKGERKAQWITAIMGDAPFVYVGNSCADVPIWQKAKAAVCVNTPASVLAKAKNVTQVEAVLHNKAAPVKSWLKAFRVHQYVKNALLFLPMVLGHVFSWGLVLNLGLAFLCFCTLASSVYIANDLLDLRADRTHQKKRFRPFASGALDLSQGVVVALLLLLVAAMASVSLSADFKWVLLTYYIVTLAYSLDLKSRLLVDVVVLAALYTLRILAGMAELAAPYSIWLLLFSLFFFYSLALVKRYSELLNKVKLNIKNVAGRAYQKVHLPVLMQLGVSSGVVACVIFGLYLNSEKAASLYAHPDFLYLVCLVFLYWLSRLWLLASEGRVHEDPVVFAIKDQCTYIVVAITTVILILAAL